MLRVHPFILFSTVVMLCCAGCSSPMQSEAKKILRPSAVQDFSPESVEQWTLPNGLTVVYMQDNELPVVRGSLYVRGGSFWEDPQSRGVMAVMGDQMRQGGAGSLSADQLDLELQKLSASVTASIGGEFGKFSFGCLRSDLDQVFGLFQQVLFHPRFEESRLELWRGQALDSIERRKDEGGTVASLAFQQLLFGDSVYGWVAGSSDVRRVKRSDLVAAYENYLRPQGAILTLVGQLDRKTAHSLVDAAFASWKSKDGTLPPPPSVKYRPKPGIYFIELPFSQATVYAGHAGPPRLTPDYPAIDGFNQVFGASGFGSRLMRKIRTELGLAYGIYGAIAPGRVLGRNMIAFQTKGASAGTALVESLRVLHGMQLKDIQSEELEETKRAVDNSFVFRFVSPEQLVDRAALLKLLEYPSDYDESYMQKIRALETSDIRATAQKYWNFHNLVVVVVGDKNAYASLQKAFDGHPAVLSDLPLRRISFDEKVVLP